MSKPQKRKGPSLTDRLASHLDKASNYDKEAGSRQNKRARNNINNKRTNRHKNNDPTTENTTSSEKKSAWADSDDEDTIATNGKAVNDISLVAKNAMRKYRTDVTQTSTTQSSFIEERRKHFENRFNTPDWAKIDVKEDNKVKKAFKDSDDDDDGDQDDSDDDSNNDDDDDDDNDDRIKEENIKTDDIKTEYDSTLDKKNNNKNTQTTSTTGIDGASNIIELNYESEELIRQAQEGDQERTLAQLESLFSTNKSLKQKTSHRGQGTLTSGTLRKDRLEIEREPDANAALSSKSVISSCGFHDNNQLLFCAGMDKCLRLFQMDGVTNPCVQSLLFDSMPIFKAGFINHQSEILVTGRRKYLQVVNLLTGQATKIPDILGRNEKSWEYWVPSHNSKYIAFIGDNNTIVVVSAITKQFICEIRCNGGLNDLTWSMCDEYIYTTGNDGLIYCYHVGKRQQMFSFRDQGVHHGTVLSLSDNGQYFATGSTNGVVNVYDTNFEDLLTKTQSYDYTKDSFASYYGSYNSHEENVKMPLSEVVNLTTKADYIKWSPSTEIMAIGSRHKKDALRLVHIPTFSVFQNWPTQNTPFSYIQDIAWSADNTRIAIANDKGRVLLYSLRHYQKGCNLKE